MEVGKKAAYIVKRADNGFILTGSDGNVLVFNTTLDVARDIANGILGKMEPGMEIEFAAKRNK